MDSLIAQNFYLKIFIEAARYASFNFLSSEPTFFAMHAFSSMSGLYSFNMPIEVICAVAGAALGAILNFTIGCFVKNIYLKQKHPKHLSTKQYERAKQFFNRFGVILLFISWFPLLNFAVFAAGFLGMRARIAIPIIIIGQTAHYGWFLFH